MLKSRRRADAVAVAHCGNTSSEGKVPRLINRSTRLQSGFEGPPKKTNEEFSGNKKAVVIIFRRKESAL
jgi:hypothetical protein